MNTTTESNSLIAWLALIIAVIALIVGWVAYNRSGVDLEAQVEREVDEALIDLSTQFEAAEQEVREGTADTLETGSEALEEGAEDARTDEENATR